MNSKLLILVILVLLVISQVSAKKKGLKNKTLHKDACACDATFQPVCDTTTHTTYPSKCLARCMGVRFTSKGACAVKVKTIVKNICKKDAKSKKFDKVTADLIRELIERTKQVERKIQDVQAKVGKVEALRGAEDEIKEIVSKIPAKLNQQPIVAKPVATPAAPVQPTPAVPVAPVSKKGNKKTGKKSGKKGTKKGSKSKKQK